MINRVTISFLIVLSGLYCSNFITWPENSRIMLTRAIVDHGTIKLDQVIKEVLIRDETGLDQMTMEYSFYGGNFFFDKAPYLSFSLIPIYVIGKLVVGPPPFTGSDYTVIVLLSIFWVSILPSVIVFLELERILRIQGCQKPIFFASIYSLCTISLLYTGQLFQYQIVAAILLISFRLLLLQQKTFTSGLLAGIACGFDYLSIFFAVFGLVKPKFLAGFCLGIIPLLGYHFAISGDPFTPPYLLKADLALTGTGITHTNSQSLQLADVFSGRFLEILENSLFLLFYPYRGLFFYVPLLLLIPFGFSYVRRSHLGPLLLFPLCIVIISATKNQWWFGASYGPRYFISFLPFLFILVSLGRGSLYKFLLVSLLSISLLQTLAGVRRLAYFPKPTESPSVSDYKMCYSQVLNTFEGGLKYHFKAYIQPLLTKGLEPPLVGVLIDKEPIHPVFLRLDSFGLGCNPDAAEF